MRRALGLTLAIVWPAAVLVGCWSSSATGTVTATGLSARVLSPGGPPFGGPPGTGHNQVPILAATSLSDLCALAAGPGDVVANGVPIVSASPGLQRTDQCLRTTAPPTPSLFLGVETNRQCLNTDLHFALSGTVLGITATRTSTGCWGLADTQPYVQSELSLVAIPLSRLPQAPLTVLYDGLPAQTVRPAGPVRDGNGPACAGARRRPRDHRCHQAGNARAWARAHQRD